jgi:GNAT superfamily N-acetyltransferase
MFLREVPILHKPELDPLTYAVWGTDIRWNQWQYRENALCSVRWAREGMRAWKHVDARGDVQATCETFRMDHRDSGHVYGIASVVTPEPFRGRGNAGRLLTAVMKRVESEDPKCRGWILYSEVDPKVYERVGFRAITGWDWILPPVTKGEDLGSSGELRWLSHQDAVRSFRPSPGSLIQVTGEQLEWHFERERVYREFLKPWHLPRELRAGCDIPDHGRILWFVNYRENYLQILLLETDSKHGMTERRETAGKLLQAAQGYAATLNLTHVCLWNSEDESVRDSCPAASVQPKPRPDTIPMIRGIEPSLWLPSSRSTWC